MKIPAGAFIRDCMTDVKTAVESRVGILSKREKDKNVTALSANVSNAAAITPRSGVQIKKLPDMKDAERKPTIPLASMFGPSIDEDRLSSRAPMRTPKNRPFVLPYRIPIKYTINTVKFGESPMMDILLCSRKAKNITGIHQANFI